MILPRLYSVIDVELCARAGWAPRDLARVHFDAGVRLLQLRAKVLESGPFLDLARAIADDARAADALFIVNDRADLAVLSGASGVHLGQDDLPAADARSIVGANSLVGVSTHTTEQIVAVAQMPISYLAIGPIFATSTKATGYESVGYNAVREAAAVASPKGLPVVAIGGITLATARHVIDAGAASVAVISDLVTGDPAARVRQYLAALA